MNSFTGSTHEAANECFSEKFGDDKSLVRLVRKMERSLSREACVSMVMNHARSRDHAEVIVRKALYESMTPWQDHARLYVMPETA